MRAGLSGARSGLFSEQIRVIREMRETDKRNGRTDIHVRPRFGVWENVPYALKCIRHVMSCNPVFIKDYLGHADISTTEVYARADNEAKRAALEKATAHLDLPKASHWEQDTELIEWLSSLG